MKVRIGTIEELTGTGIEILVDAETRNAVLARFMDGKMIGSISDSSFTPSNSAPQYVSDEKTIITLN